jgi:hypothetical protein
MANNRKLLDRLNGVMVQMVVLADDEKLQLDEIVRLLDVRKIGEALEVSRILFTMFGGKVIPPANEMDKADHVLADVTGAIGVGGRSCWTRHMLHKVQYEVEKFELESRDGFSKSYDNLVGILADMQHATRKCRSITCYTPKILRIMQRIRQLPNAYRDFYIRIDGLLLP